MGRDMGAGMAEFELMTYREVADKFGLKSPDAARVKVKRAGWKTRPGNHPNATLFIEVPHSAISERSLGIISHQPPVNAPPADMGVIAELRAQIALLTDQAARDRAALDAMRLERDEKELCLKISEAELRQALERAGRAEGEIVGLRRRGLLSWLR